MEQTSQPKSEPQIQVRVVVLFLGLDCLGVKHFTSRLRVWGEERLPGLAQRQKRLKINASLTARMPFLVRRYEGLSQKGEFWLS